MKKRSSTKPNDSGTGEVRFSGHDRFIGFFSPPSLFRRKDLCDYHEKT